MTARRSDDNSTVRKRKGVDRKCLRLFSLFIFAQCVCSIYRQIFFSSPTGMIQVFVGMTPFCWLWAQVLPFWCLLRFFQIKFTLPFFPSPLIFHNFPQFVFFLFCISRISRGTCFIHLVLSCPNDSMFRILKYGFPCLSSSV